MHAKVHQTTEIICFIFESSDVFTRFIGMSDKQNCDISASQFGNDLSKPDRSLRPAGCDKFLKGVNDDHVNRSSRSAFFSAAAILCHNTFLPSSEVKSRLF